MSGILLIGVVLLWVWMAVVIGQMLTSKFKDSWIKSLVTFVVTAALIPLPVADEIVGGFQFRKLCEQHGRKEVDYARAKGMTLIAGRVGGYQPVDGTLLAVSASRHTYLDPVSNIPIIEYLDYRVDGGWFIHALGISETNSPLTFSPSCGGYGDNSSQGWLDRYQIKVIYNR